jgi:hypothetical protein
MPRIGRFSNGVRSANLPNWEVFAAGTESALMVREGPPQPAPPRGEPYPAEKARGGEIILTTPLRRWVFISGLAGAVALALVLGLLR